MKHFSKFVLLMFYYLIFSFIIQSKSKILMLFHYALLLNSSIRLRNSANQSVYNQPAETFKTLLMNEAKYAELEKAHVSYHSVSKVYEISIPSENGNILTYAQKIEQGFICDGNFVSVPKETELSRLSPLGIAIIGVFASILSVVISAPSVIGLKLMEGIQILIDYSKRKDENEMKNNPEMTELPKTDVHKDYKTTAVEIYTYVSFVFAFIAFFVIGEVLLSSSSFVSIKESYTVNTCKVLVPDQNGRKLLSFPNFNHSPDNRMTNADFNRALLHHLNTNPEFLQNVSDDLSESASYITQRENGKTGLTTIDVGCEGGIVQSGDVKWRLYAPWLSVSRDAKVKKWEALAKKQYDQCGSAPNGDMTIGDITYNVVSDKRMNGWKSGDGCGLFTHSFSLWRMFGRLIRNYNVVTVTKTPQEFNMGKVNYSGKWVLQRQPIPGNNTYEYMIEGEANTFSVEVEFNNTWGNFRISDGIYHYNSNRFYNDNKDKSITSRWCVIPPPVDNTDQLYKQVFTKAELDLIYKLQNEQDNLAMFQKTIPNRVRDQKPWDTASFCFGGQLHDTKQCIAHLTFKAKGEWTEFLPPCSSGQVYANGPRVYFRTPSTEYCSVQVTNDPELGTPTIVRIKNNEDNYVIGATHINCNTHKDSDIFGDCSKREVQEYEKLYYKVVDAVQLTQVIDHGVEASTGWSMFGDFNLGSVMIIACCFVGGIIFIFIMYKCRIPCKITLCICRSCKKYDSLEEENE
jgi:hypothetical protein